MKKTDVDDYLQEGIYGAKETKPAERKRFLGTLRERIVLALTKGQVMKNEGLSELEKEITQNPDAKLLLNGDISYRFLRDYKVLADKHGMHHTAISNRETETDIGAVLTYDHAIDKENIYVEEKREKEEESNESNVESNGLSGFFKSLFKSK